jgi:hypothetical protein
MSMACGSVLVLPAASGEEGVPQCAPFFIAHPLQMNLLDALKAKAGNSTLSTAFGGILSIAGRCRPPKVRWPSADNSYPPGLRTSAPWAYWLRYGR